MPNARLALLVSAMLLPQEAWAQIDPPSVFTVAHNAQAAQSLTFADRRDFDFADRGLLGTRADPKIRGAKGNVVCDLAAFDQFKQPAPPRLNPCQCGNRNCCRATGSSR